MPRYIVTFEDTASSGLGKEHDPIEPELTAEELRGANDTRIAEGLFPPGVLRIASAHVTPDDSVYENGRDEEGDVKLFVSIDLVVEADDEDAAEAFKAPARLLNEIAESLGSKLDLEGSWEALMAEPAYVVQNVDDAQTFWSNDHGWGDRAGADAFTSAEKDALNLPVGGQWVRDDAAIPNPVPSA